MNKMTEREEFEDHCLAIGKSINKFVDGEYVDDGTTNAWYWFQVGRSMSSKEFLTCANCAGKGIVPDMQYEPTECKNCKGNGVERNE